MDNMKISACWIAKNEAINIRRSMESVKEIADELIVVDTGSEDETVEIAFRRFALLRGEFLSKGTEGHARFPAFSGGCTHLSFHPQCHSPPAFARRTPQGIGVSHEPGDRNGLSPVHGNDNPAHGSHVRSVGSAGILRA